MNRQKPFIVEFTGTPEAGKTTILTLLKQSLESSGFTVKVYPESAEKSKSIFPRDSYGKSKFDAKFWMHLEILKNLVEAPYQNYDIILFDRGALDKKFWINLDACNGDFDDRIIYLSKLFDDVLPDLLIVLKVSVDESLRRRGGEGHVVTREFLERYNALLNHFVNSLKINKDIICTDNMKVEEVLNVVVNSILENLNKPS